MRIGLSVLDAWEKRMNEIQLYRHTDPDLEKGYKAFFGLAANGLGYNAQEIIGAHHRTSSHQSCGAAPTGVARCALCLSGEQNY